MYHQRNNISKLIPLARKGTAYIASPRHNKSTSVSLLIALRDMLKIISTKRELKRLLKEKQILVNQKFIKDTNYPITLFDTIVLPKSEKNFRLIFNNKKFGFEEVSKKSVEAKAYKLIKKTKLKHKKIQLNFGDGKNIISEEKINPGDSAIISFKDNKILQIIPLEKGRSVQVIKGKHIGKNGKIDSIIERGKKKIAKIITNNEKINVWVLNLIVYE